MYQPKAWKKESESPREEMGSFATSRKKTWEVLRRRCRYLARVGIHLKGFKRKSRGRWLVGDKQDRKAVDKAVSSGDKASELTPENLSARMVYNTTRSGPFERKSNRVFLERRRSCRFVQLAKKGELGGKGSCP